MQRLLSATVVLTSLALLLVPVDCTPKEWDWRSERAVTPVKNQYNCSAGWAFAVTAAYESFLIRANGSAYDLSEEYLIQCSGQGDCSGCKNIRKTM